MLDFVPNRLWIYPSQNALCGRLIPEWGQQVAVLGFAPARGLSRAHQSQNDLEQGAGEGPRRGDLPTSQTNKQPFEHKTECLYLKKQLRS